MFLNERERILICFKIVHSGAQGNNADYGEDMMLCTNDDKTELMEFLLQNPTENCFFIGDIENYDLEAEFINVWKFQANNKISSVLLRYYKFYLIASGNDNDLNEISRIIEEDKNCITVSGTEKTIEKIARFLNFVKIKKTFLAELNQESFNEFPKRLVPQKATIDDIDDLFNFQKSIKEFSIDERTRDSFGKDITANTGKCYYIKEHNSIVSSATITAENSVNGMIIGVATAPQYRNKGYAQACVGELCMEMISSGKSVVLFYDNPGVGKLYKKIGFIDVGKWSVGTLR